MTLSISGKRMVYTTPASSIYRETIDIVDDSPGSGELQGPLAIGTVITLPSSGTYEDIELQVRVNGISWVPGVHYNYVGAGPTRTQISTLEIIDGTRANPTIIEFYRE